MAGQQRKVLNGSLVKKVSNNNSCQGDLEELNKRRKMNRTYLECVTFLAPGHDKTVTPNPIFKHT